MRGTIFPTPYQAEFTVNELGRDFAAVFEERFGTAPDMFAAQGYTAAWMLATAIRDAGSSDPADVGQALAAITQLESVYGTLTFESGQAEVAEPARVLVWGKDGTLSEWVPGA